MKDTLILSGPERQNLILQALQRQPRISVTAICEQFQISEATARRDLESLSAQGKIQRIHGGAIAPFENQAPPELPMLQRQSEQAAEKSIIGRTAAALVSPGESLFLGSGTSVHTVARSLRERGLVGLTVTTNSLPVVNTLADCPGITLVCLGGILRSSELSFIGHITEQSLAEVRFDRVIIGTRAMHLEHGLTNDYLPETMTDRAIINAGRQLIVVADHTKLGRISTAFLAPIERIHILVTDQGVPVDFVESARQHGLQVIQG